MSETWANMLQHLEILAPPLLQLLLQGIITLVLVPAFAIWLVTKLIDRRNNRNG